MADAGGWLEPSILASVLSQAARLAVRPIRPPVVARRKIECSPNDFANIHNRQPPAYTVATDLGVGEWSGRNRNLNTLRYIAKIFICAF